MKNIALVCSGIALVAGIIAVNLRLELRKEREVTAVLQGQPSEVLPPIKRPAAPPPEAAPPATAAAETPEDRKLQLARLRSTTERFYPGLIQELGLSEEEADRLLDLLAENQLARAADGSSLAASDRTLENSIQTLLGSKYTQWQAYQQTLSVRPEVATMVSQLAQARGSLSAGQIKGLTGALIAERQRQLQEGMSNPRSPPGDPEDAGYRAQMRGESLKRTEENNRRMLEVATPYIDATELAVLREQLDRQTSMTRQMLGTQKESERRQAQPSQ